MSAKATEPIDSYRISLPEQWVHLNPDRRVIDLAYERCIENLKEAGYELSKTEQRKIEAIFGQLRNNMLAEGIADLALYADADEGKDNEPMVLAAALAVRHVSKQSLDTEMALNPNLLRAVFAAERPPAEAVRPTSKFTDLEAPKVVSLECGQALRLQRMLEYRRGVVEVTKLYTDSFLVPHDDTYEKMSMFQFSTPTLNLSTEFASLFFSIIKTLQFLKEDEPTMPAEDTSV